LNFYGEFKVGDYLRYKDKYGIIDDVFYDWEGKITVKIQWYTIDKDKQRISGTQIKYHEREILYEAERVEKSAVMVELL